MKKGRSNSVLLTFLLTNLLIVFIPLAILSIAYYSLTSQVKRDIESSTEKQARQGQKMVEAQLSSSHRISTLLSSHKEILLNSAKKSFTPIEWYNLRAVNSLLSNYVNVHDGIHSVYIDLPRSNIVISNDALYSYDNFYGTFFSYGGMTKDEWIQQTYGTYSIGRFLPLASIMTKGYRFNGTAYVKSIGGVSGAVGTIIIVYDNDTIMESITFAEDSYASWWSCIRDADNNTVFESEGMPDKALLPALSRRQPAGVHNYKGYVVVSGSSIQDGLSYISVFKHSDVFAQATAVLKMSYVFCVAAAVIGMTISFAVARTHTKPVMRVMNALDNPSGQDLSRTGVYRKIEHGVQELRGQIDSQKHALQAFYVQKLLYRKFAAPKEAREEAAAVHFNWPEANCQVALLRMIPLGDSEAVNGWPELADLSASIDMLLINITEICEFIYQEDSRNFVLLLKSNENIRDHLNRLLAVIRKELAAYPGFFVAIGVGSSFGKPLEITESYNEASTAISGKIDTPGAALVFYTDLPAKNTAYYYPVKSESDLTRYVKTGNRSKIAETLAHIFEVNMFNRYLSPNMTKQLIAEICGTLLRLSEAVISFERPDFSAFHAMYENLSGAGDLEEAHELSGQIFTMLAEKYHALMKSHNTGLISKILGYTENNYTDESLSLSKISSVFDINETYLSSFFKEQTGNNFSVYVEELRINHAINLLENKNFSIEQIAAKAGYSNQHSFRRAFKKVMHITPSDYRKSASTRNIES